MKRLTLILFALAFFALNVHVFAQGNSNAKPKMVVEQPTFEAGDIYRSGEKLQHVFVIKNAGGAELQILSAKPG